MFLSQFLVINWIHKNHLINAINESFLTMLMGI